MKDWLIDWLIDWLNEWMIGWMNVWINERTNERTNERINKYTKKSHLFFPRDRYINSPPPPPTPRSLVTALQSKNNAKYISLKAGVNPNRSEIWSIIKRELLGLK